MSTNATPSPRIVIFAGPNGAGKSTHADAIVAALGIATFVNADYIARGLSGRNTDVVAFEAGRIMLKRLRQLGEAEADFAFESSLSSRMFARCMCKLMAHRYAVAIYYFSLANAQLAIRRVKLRVALGGHDVPSDVIKRRFGRSISNFFKLDAPLAGQWALFDNSASILALPVATQTATQLTITEAKTWRRLQKLSKLV